jgi:hypothetical protein
MLSYHAQLALRIHNFGIMLEPRWIVGTERLDQ